MEIINLIFNKKRENEIFSKSLVTAKTLQSRIQRQILAMLIKQPFVSWFFSFLKLNPFLSSETSRRKEGRAVKLNGKRTFTAAFISFHPIFFFVATNNELKDICVMQIPKSFDLDCNKKISDFSEWTKSFSFI